MHYPESREREKLEVYANIFSHMSLLKRQGSQPENNSWQLHWWIRQIRKSNHPQFAPKTTPYDKKIPEAIASSVLNSSGILIEANSTLLNKLKSRLKARFHWLNRQLMAQRARQWITRYGDTWQLKWIRHLANLWIANYSLLHCPDKMHLQISNSQCVHRPWSDYMEPPTDIRLN